MFDVTFLLDDEDETNVGHGFMPHTPRVGELIWLRDVVPELKQTEYVVLRIAYWVPNRDGITFRVECNSAAVYVEKTKG